MVLSILLVQLDFVNTVDMQSALSVAGAVIANGGANINNGLYINGTELANDNGL